MSSLREWLMAWWGARGRQRACCRLPRWGVEDPSAVEPSVEKCASRDFPCMTRIATRKSAARVSSEI